MDLDVCRQDDLTDSQRQHGRACSVCRGRWYIFSPSFSWLLSFSCSWDDGSWSWLGSSWSENGGEVVVHNSLAVIFTGENKKDGVVCCSFYLHFSSQQTAVHRHGAIITMARGRSGLCPVTRRLVNSGLSPDVGPLSSSFPPFIASMAA